MENVDVNDNFGEMGTGQLCMEIGELNIVTKNII